MQEARGNSRTRVGQRMFICERIAHVRLLCEHIAHVSVPSTRAVIEVSPDFNANTQQLKRRKKSTPRRRWAFALHERQHAVSNSCIVVHVLSLSLLLLWHFGPKVAPRCQCRRCWKCNHFVVVACYSDVPVHCLLFCAFATPWSPKLLALLEPSLAQRIVSPPLHATAARTTLTQQTLSWTLPLCPHSWLREF